MKPGTEPRAARPFDVSPELKEWLPPLTAPELAQLEENILAEGIRDPLVVWDGVLVDGHNRLAIATEHGLDYAVVEMEFDSLDAAKLWMWRNQAGKRNLPAFVRGEMALKIKPILAAVAKEKERARKSGEVTLSNLTKSEPADTARELAEQAGVSYGTYSAISKVVESPSATPELLAACRSGDIAPSVAKEIVELEPEVQAEVVADGTASAVAKAVRAESKRKKAQSRKERQAEAAAAPAPVDGLVCGDAIEGLRSLPDESVDLVVTDPPYNMGKAAWDSYGSGYEFARWCEAWLDECGRILKPHGAIYIFGINRMLSHLQRHLDSHFVYRNWIIWDTVQGAGGGLWVNRHEAILYYSKTTETYEDPDAVKLERHEENVREYRGKVYQFKSPSNVWRFPCVDNRAGDRTAHITQKPVELIQRIVRASSHRDGIVLDPFMGSGTTAVAAIREGRRWLGFENDPAHYEIAAKRVANEVSM